MNTVVLVLYVTIKKSMNWFYNTMWPINNEKSYKYKHINIHLIYFIERWGWYTPFVNN